MIPVSNNLQEINEEYQKFKYNLFKKMYEANDFSFQEQEKHLIISINDSLQKLQSNSEKGDENIMKVLIESEILSKFSLHNQKKCIYFFSQINDNFPKSISLRKFFIKSVVKKINNHTNLEWNNFINNFHHKVLKIDINQLNHTESVENCLIYVEYLIQYSPSFIQKYCSDIIFILFQIIQTENYFLDLNYDISNYFNSIDQTKYYANWSIELLRKIFDETKFFNFSCIEIDKLFEWKPIIKPLATISILFEKCPKCFIKKNISKIHNFLESIEDSNPEIQCLLKRDKIFSLIFEEKYEQVDFLFEYKNQEENLICGLIQNIKLLMKHENLLKKSEVDCMKIKELILFCFETNKTNLKNNAFDLLNCCILYNKENQTNYFEIDSLLFDCLKQNDLHFDSFEVLKFMKEKDEIKFTEKLIHSINQIPIETLEFIKDKSQDEIFKNYFKSNEVIIEKIQNLLDHNDNKVKSLSVFVLGQISPKLFYSEKILQKLFHMLSNDPSNRVKFSILHCFNIYLADFSDENLEEKLSNCKIIDVFSDLLNKNAVHKIQLETIKIICKLAPFKSLKLKKLVKPYLILFNEKNDKKIENILLSAEFMPFIFDSFPHYIQKYFLPFHDFSMNFLNSKIEVNSLIEKVLIQKFFCSFNESLEIILQKDPEIIRPFFEEIVNFCYDCLENEIDQIETQSILSLLQKVLFQMGLNEVMSNKKIKSTNLLFTAVYEAGSRFMNSTIHHHVFEILGFLGAQPLFESIKPLYNNSNEIGRLDFELQKELIKFGVYRSYDNIYCIICSNFLLKILEKESLKHLHIQAIETLTDIIKMTPYSSHFCSYLIKLLRICLKHMMEIVYTCENEEKKRFIPMLQQILKCNQNIRDGEGIFDYLVQLFIELWKFGSIDAFSFFVKDFTIRLQPFLNSFIPFIQSCDDSDKVINTLFTIYNFCFIESSSEDPSRKEILMLIIQLGNEGKYNAISMINNYFGRIKFVNLYAKPITEMCINYLRSGQNNDENFNNAAKLLAKLMSNCRKELESFAPTIIELLMPFQSQLKIFTKSLPNDMIKDLHLDFSATNQAHTNQPNTINANGPSGKTINFEFNLPLNQPIEKAINFANQPINKQPNEKAIKFNNQPINQPDEKSIKFSNQQISQPPNQPDEKSIKIGSNQPNEKSIKFSSQQINQSPSQPNKKSINFGPNQPNEKSIKFSNQPISQPANQPNEKSIKLGSNQPNEKSIAFGLETSKSQPVINSIPKKSIERSINIDGLPRYSTYNKPANPFLLQNGQLTQLIMIINDYIEDDSDPALIDLWLNELITFCIKNSPSSIISSCYSIIETNDSFALSLFNAAFHSMASINNNFINFSDDRQMIGSSFLSVLKSNKTSNRCRAILTDLIEFMDRMYFSIFEPEDFKGPLTSIFSKEPQISLRYSLLKFEKKLNPEFKEEILNDLEQSFLNCGYFDQFNQLRNDFRFNQSKLPLFKYSFDNQKLPERYQIHHEVISHLYRIETLIEKYSEKNDEKIKNEIINEINLGFDCLTSESGPHFSQGFISVIQSIIYSQQLIELKEMISSNFEINNFRLRLLNSSKILRFIPQIYLMKILTQRKKKDSFTDKLNLLSLCRKCNEWELMLQIFNDFYQINEKNCSIPVEIQYEMMYNKINNNTANEEEIDDLINQIKNIEHDDENLLNFAKFQKATFISRIDTKDPSKLEAIIDLCNSFDDVNAIELCGSSNLKIFELTHDSNRLNESIKNYTKSSLRSEKVRISNILTIIYLLFTYYNTDDYFDEININQIINTLNEIPLHFYIDVMSQFISYITTLRDNSFADFIKELLSKIMIRYPQGVIYDYSFSIFSDQKLDGIQIIESPIQVVKDSINDQKIMNIFFEAEMLTQSLIDVNSVLPEVDEIEETKKTKKKEITDLFVLSPRLMQNRDMDLPVFGTYHYNDEIIYIHEFSNKFKEIKSLEKPKKISVIGRDGNSYPFILKEKEDLRTDQRIMIFHKFLNHHLKNKIKTYSIIPLTSNQGLIQVVQEAIGLYRIIDSYRKKVSPQEARYEYNYLDQNLFKSTHPYKYSYDLLNTIQRLEVFKEIISNKDRELDLKNCFWYFTTSSEKWVNFISNYTSSCAVISMVTYIIGLGDRHLRNIMINKDSGTLMNIDFCDVFEIDQTRDDVPETVPFRLTRNMVNALGPSGCNGCFTKYCEETLAVMRINKDNILKILKVFVDSPIQPINSYNIYTLIRDEEEIMRSKNEAIKALKRIDKKLNGTDVYIIHSNDYDLDNNVVVDKMSVLDHVKRLIEFSTDENNLYLNFSDWEPWK